MRYTPGPWRLERSTPGQGYHCILAANDAYVIGPDDGWNASYRDYDERLANANLIAAAPELLAALKETSRVLAEVVGDMVADDLERYTRQLQRAHVEGVGLFTRSAAAIAKAEQ